MSRASSPSTSQQGSSQMQQGQLARDQIAMRAYEKWCRRGRTHGHDRQDWLEAEQELRNESNRGATSSMRH